MSCIAEKNLSRHCTTIDKCSNEGIRWSGKVTCGSCRRVLTRAKFWLPTADETQTKLRTKFAFIFHCTLHRYYDTLRLALRLCGSVVRTWLSSRQQNRLKGHKSVHRWLRLLLPLLSRSVSLSRPQSTYTNGKSWMIIITNSALDLAWVRVFPFKLRSSGQPRQFDGQCVKIKRNDN